ncbi:hypothetical protein COX03_02955 [Candidatus Woesebacteria bacterium CG22_combo_CG10-13_8_21_14_all_39_10]|uniref:Gram-positive cocci surface proteins LPxTG domain-containing protein n=3 Tax=Candidatus Woeseibacteriota TaxID=1752722 RepID=A0A2M7AQD7_9BACT|nr:MAG: hypothetical protein COX03_02955 [Candidatus Woesebacteria bacterium CG22_combo_CG10-13_8_21_14_all_39_10]PIU71846.1 MAG: hypothetical protein COS80_01005 [Candidatus Woesebacteria bacterium CG06_land_8_20_14_3_00_39_27]PIZ49261.1 MAG: hypothetical protein COY29_02160 [Candidatus Woesebacteria bacterium CG_4_10_14_0_2_um_filter_39_14]
MKKLILILILASSFALTSPVIAQEQVCTTVYGGGTVCGAHTPVETDLGDINPVILGSILLTISGVLYFYSNKKSLKAKEVNNK